MSTKGSTTNRSSRRQRAQNGTQETSEAEEQSASVPAEGLIDEVPPQMAFFESLRGIPSLDWGHYQVFLYRLEPRVRNAGPAKYIDIFSAAFNEADVKERHGGGKYYCLLKNQDSGQLERKCTFEIEGAPKLFRSQVVLDERGQEVPVTPPANAGTDSSIIEVLKQLVTALDGKKMPADEAIRSAMETLNQAQKGAMQIMIDAAQVKAGSQTGNAMMDEIFKEFLKSLTATRQSNPMSDFKEMLTTMKELRNLTGSGDDATPRKASFLDEARGLAEILKVDTDGSLRGILFGKTDEDQMPATGWGAAFKFFGDAITRRPEILDHGARLLGAMADRLTSRPGVAQPTVIRPVPQPTLSAVGPIPVAVQTPAAATPVPPVEVPAAQSEGIAQVVIDELLRAIMSGYVQGYTGAAVAESLRMLYPNVLPPLTEYLNIPDALVMMWLRQQKLLEPIVHDAEFPAFVQEFKQAVLHPEQFAESEPEAAESSTAGNTPSATSGAVSPSA